MNVIYKYPLAIDDRQVVKLPKGAKILTVQIQHGIPCLWALVNNEAAPESRVILTFGTGHMIPKDTVPHLEYIATYQVNGGQLIFHCFEEK